jgi:hypothetical protein
MEIDSSLVLKIKNSIRIKHTALDEDIEDTIRAALVDLSVCGVIAPPADDPQDMDPLILNAVKLFCKVEYTDDTAKAAIYQQRYDSLKSCLMMADGYREVPASE